MTLQALQREFKLRVRAERRAIPAEICWVRDQPPLSPSDRIEVYRYAYFARLLGSFREDFPAVEKTLGKKYFAAAVRKFLNQQPSRFQNIGEASLGFHRSLKLKALSELARWEWEHNLAWVTEDAVSDGVLPFSELGKTPVTEWKKIRFKLSASVRIFESKWPVKKISRKNFKTLKADSRRQSWLIWSQDGYSENQQLSQPQKELIQAMQEGTSALKLLERMQKTGVSPQQALRWFEKWVVQGVIQGLIRRNR